jgi:hypothetical protein
MTTHLNHSVANSYQSDMLREAKLARLAANGTRHETLFRRAFARLHADAGRSPSARRTYELAPTDR